MKLAGISIFALAAILAMSMLATAAHAETWYLMTPDANVIGNPKAATVMDKGAVIGPVHFLSRGQFSSRDGCATARQKTVREWRQRGIMAKGGWRSHGLNSANSFVQCIPQNDPRLKPAAGGARSMSVLVNKTRPYRIRGR